MNEIKEVDHDEMSDLYPGTGSQRKILRQVRKEELKERYRRETEPWDMKMDQVPPLPKDWEHWVDKTGFTQNYIFYDYQRKGAKEVEANGTSVSEKSAKG